MTIEEKVREIIEVLIQKSIVTSLKDADGEKAIQLILAMIKLMSKEKLSDIILKKLVYAPRLSCDIADAILAEWGKE